MFEKINFEGWPNCIRLYNKTVELIVTTDVGPRIIRFGFIGGSNLFYVSDKEKGLSGGDQWHIYGGHRLWHAPEEMPRTYFPDNKPVTYSWDGKALKLFQETEVTTGIIKEIEITLDPEKDHVKILHRLVNKNLWTIETSPWSITAFSGEGKAILPQEPYIDPTEYLLPARPIVLWYYTQMNDPRWVWGDKYIQLKHDSNLKAEQKIGILNKQGWAAYSCKNDLMIKRFEYDSNALYPDYGCNNEIYVNENLLEIETLGPVHKIAPNESIVHTEHWMLVKLEDGKYLDSEINMDRNLLPIVNSVVGPGQR